MRNQSLGEGNRGKGGRKAGGENREEKCGTCTVRVCAMCIKFICTASLHVESLLCIHVQYDLECVASLVGKQQQKTGI